MKVGLSLLVVLSMAACSRDPVPATTASSGTPAAQSGGGSESVAAVAQGGPGRAVTLRFVLEGRPSVGTASNLQLEFSAATPQAGVSFRIDGGELGFNAAGSSQVIDLSEAGRNVTQTVAFTPRVPGLVQATVHVQPGTEAAEIVYAIPVLVEPAAP